MEVTSTVSNEDKKSRLYNQFRAEVMASMVLVEMKLGLCIKSIMRDIR